MAVTFGFYNSQNGDRVYNAEQMSSIFSGIIQDGVFENFPASGQHFHVEWVSGQEGSKIVVGPGRAWLKDTWTDNDANLVLTLDPATQNDRIDAVIIEINKTNTEDATAGMYDGLNGASEGGNGVPGRFNKIMIVKGTPSANPVKPTLRNGNGIYQYYLALVRVSTDSTHRYISSMVGNASQDPNVTPYIIGAVQSVSNADVISQWTNALNAAILQFHQNGQQEIDSVVETYFNDPGSAVYSEIRALQNTLEGEITNAVNGVKPLEIAFRISNGSVITNAVYSDIDRAVESNRAIKFQYVVISGSTGSGGRRGNKSYYCYRFYRDSWTQPVNMQGVRTYHIEFINDTHDEIVRITVDRGNEIHQPGNDQPSQPTYETVLSYEIIPLKPLEARFTVENNTAVCDKTFEELSAAILAGRDLLLFYDDAGNHTKLTYRYHTVNSDTAVDFIQAYNSHIVPVTPGTVEDDWAWDYISFEYSQSRLTYDINAQ